MKGPQHVTMTSALPVPAVAAAPRSQAVVLAKSKRPGWGMKLIPRLARLLPQGDTPYGKKLVKKILAKHGWTKKPYLDESRALEIFRQRESMSLHLSVLKMVEPFKQAVLLRTRPTFLHHLMRLQHYWLSTSSSRSAEAEDGRAPRASKAIRRRR